MTEPLDQVNIYVSKTKTVLLLICAFAFVFMGILFLIEPSKFISSHYNNPIIISIVGFASVVFFGICFFVGLLKTFQKRPAYIIDDNGITYNTKQPNLGIITWDDIERVSVIKVKSTKLIIIHLKDPFGYIEKQKGIFKKMMMRFALKQYNAPISLSTSGAKISHDELMSMLNERLTKYKLGNKD